MKDTLGYLWVFKSFFKQMDSIGVIFLKFKRSLSNDKLSAILFYLRAQKIKNILFYVFLTEKNLYIGKSKESTWTLCVTSCRAA